MKRKQKRAQDSSLKQWFLDGHNFWILVALSFLLFLFNAARLPIIDGDTFYYISHAKKIFLNNDWLNISGLMSKPPLVLWIWALTYKILGVTLFSTQLWHAVFSFLLIWVAYRLAEEMFDTKIAWFSALVLFSAFQVFYMARTPMLDVSFAAILTGFYFYFYLFIKKKKNNDLYICALLLGLAFINKGLLAFVLPGISILPFLFFIKDPIFFKKKKEQQKDMAKILISSSIILLAILPWLLPQIIVFGQKFLNYFWVENVVRFFRPIDGPSRKAQMDFYMYFIYLAIGFLPWSGYILSSFLKPLKEKWGNNRKEFIFLFCWAISPFILFSISGHWKIPRYIFPIFPAIAILLGKYWADVLANKGKYLKTSLRWGGVFSFLVALPLLLIVISAHFSVFPEESTMLKPLIFTFFSLLFSAVLIGNILLLFNKSKESFYSFFTIALLAYFSFLTIGAKVLPQFLPEKGFFTEVSSRITAQASVVVWDMPIRSADFYLNRDVKHIAELNELRRYLQNRQKSYLIFYSGKEKKKVVSYLNRKWQNKYIQQNLQLIEVY